MKRGLIIVLMVIFLATVVSGQEEPEVEFTELECDDLGVLSFKAEYIWTGYKGGYVYLKGVKVNSVKDGETTQLEGYWRKFKTEDFPQSDIKLNSPIAYFFSKKNSLKEGTYNIEIDYAVSKNNIERFKKQFSRSVRCPKQKEVVEEVREAPEEKKKEEKKEEPKVVSVKEPNLFGETPKNYTVYYIIGLLVVIFIISTFMMKKLPKKTHVKKRSSPRNVSRLFERKKSE